MGRKTKEPQRKSCRQKSKTPVADRSKYVLAPLCIICEKETIYKTDNVSFNPMSIISILLDVGR